MPGAYTHITIARLLSSGNALKDAELSHAESALLCYPEFCSMGAISPDYPYLELLDSDAEIWANAMHHKLLTSTEKNIVHLGTEKIKNMTGDVKNKCLAWFLGYVSHIVADVTCHPVTNLLVGDYEADNQTAHRESELNQDAYIFHSRCGGNVSESEHIKNVIGACSDPENNKKIDQDICQFWNELLTETFPKLAERHSANINKWHKSVQFFIDNLAEELTFIPSRHIRESLTEKGVSYPRIDEINKEKFIYKLETPAGILSYDEIFDLTLEKVVKAWKMILKGIFENEDTYKNEIRIWNLDSGEEVKTRKIMWEEVF